jgi:hypothetical protein
MSTAVAGKGLEGIVAANSGICWIDGDAGILSYRGIDIHELAEHSTFEECTYLLWNGMLPNELALREFSSQLALARSLDQRVIEMLKSFPATATPMEVLRTAVSALSFYDADEKDNSHDANVRKAYNLTAQIAMLVAIYDRIRKGKEIVPPDRSLSHAGNFLWMLNGEKPSETATRTLDIALILHADHELNASTFAARVIAATLSDIHSAITGAIGALKGFLLRLHLRHPRHRHRSLHANFRHQPHLRLGRPRHRAARRQPLNSPPRRIHRPSLSHPLGSGRRAPVRPAAESSLRTVYFRSLDRVAAATAGVLARTSP